MKTVTVRTADLLAKMQENRAAHREEFLRAQEIYRTRVIAELEARLASARAGERINTYIELTAPMDQTRDYDRVIKMLEMSVLDEVELTEREFANYVLDEWDWAMAAKAANTFYLQS